MKKVFFWFLVFILSFSAPSSCLAGRQVSKRYDYIRGEDKLEEYMVALVNRERVKRKLPPFGVDQKLIQAARQHSSEMRDLKYFSHHSPKAENETPACRLRNAGISDLTSAENIGLYSTNQKISYEKFVDKAHRGLMHSPKHKKNILHPDFNYIGVGIVRGKHKGVDTIWVTQNFVHRKMWVEIYDLEKESKWIRFMVRGELLTPQAPVIVIDEGGPVEIDKESGNVFRALVKLPRDGKLHSVKLGVITKRGREYFNYEITNELFIDTKKGEIL